MKKIKLIITVVYLTTIASFYAQERNKDIMVNKIFSVLKNKDEEAFIKLFPGAAEIRNFLIAAFSRDSTKRDELDSKDILRELNDSTMHRELSDDFRKYIKSGEDKGVDWNKAILISYTADSGMVESEDMNTISLKGTIYFNVGSNEFFLAYQEVLWFDGKGWYGVDVDRIDEKSKEAEPADTDRDANIDSAMAVADSVMVKPEGKAAKVSTEQKSSKAKSATGSPQKNKGIKAKSATAARKTVNFTSSHALGSFL